MMNWLLWTFNIQTILP